MRSCLTTGRAIALHLLLILGLTLCAVAAWWQVDRALSGNGLSWLYVFEWPAFAAVAVWLWWVLVNGPQRPPSSSAPAGGHELVWEPASESAKLQAYNAYLAELNAGGRR